MTEWREVSRRSSPSGYFSVEVNDLRRLLYIHLKRNKCEAFDVFHKTYPLDTSEGQAILSALRTAI